MKCTYFDEQVAIYDDVLAADDFRALFLWSNLADYHSVHHSEVSKVWRPADGTPLKSQPLFRHRLPSTDLTALTYPTGQAIDIFVETLACIASNDSNPVAGLKLDWKSFTVTSWVYPPGTGLSLHTDNEKYSGAFTYYLHPVWNLQWAGNLVVLDASTAPETGWDADRLPWLTDGAESVRAFDPGHGRIIFPRPNRLIFISPTAQHFVTNVDHSAGRNSRVSLAGFFARTEDPDA